MLSSCCPEVVVTCNECYCITRCGISASFRGGIFMCLFSVILRVMYLGNLWERYILKLIVFRAGDDKSVAQFSSYFVCVWTQTHPRGANFVCGCLFHGQALLISLSVSLTHSLHPCLSVFSAGIPSSRPGPVAMAIARTHLESVTTAIGPLMSCLMSTALLSSFKVGVRSSHHTFGFSHAWVH